MRVCYQCHSKYEGPGLKFCSDACRLASRAEYMTKYHRHYYTWVRAPQAPRLPRVYEERTCKRPDCSTVFTPKDNRQLYCCRRCSQQMHVPTKEANRAAALQRVLKKHGIAS